ncbi:MAG TPA: PEP/pyruvate-binding domain-containing protein [Solirubrobacteraceae bacterium]|nr:PEP/pyruvate-binding domain-containing protein [Solirubrobacteraceae bacterium]
MSGAPHARPLAELRSTDADAYGGKSAGLGELIAAGIPVPPGFALPTAAFLRFVEDAGLGPAIDAELAALSVADTRATQASAARIAELIRAAPLGDALRSDLARRYEELDVAEQPPVAVRSSALGEDGADATFAGAQESYLWVRGAEDLFTAVRDCWISLYSAEAISYRANLAAAAAPAMGVTVQLMVDAAVSGVMFTCNPVSGDPSVTAVNASWGLGLAVVAGEVTPDYFLISKVTGETVRRTLGSKPFEYVAGAGGRGAVRAEVDEARRGAACLGDEQLAELVSISRSVQRHFGSHQDIEWAIDRDGVIFIVQSRAVTAVPGAAAEAPTAPLSAMSLVMGTFGAHVGEG